MKRMLFVPLAAALVAAAPPAPSAEEKAQIAATYQQIVAARWQALGCKRDSLGMQLPLAAAMWQLEDAMKLRYDAASAKALQDTPEPKAALPCNGEEDGKQRIAADQVVFEYLTRLATLQQANAAAGWTQNIVDLSGLPPQLEAFRGQLGNILVQVYGQPQVQQMVQQIGQETVSDLAFVCESRKTKGTASPRPCPAVPAELAAVAPVGAARIANLEEMAKRFREQKDNPFGPAWHYASEQNYSEWFTRKLAGCDEHSTVVYLKDPAAVVQGQQVTLPLRNYADGTVYKAVTIKLPASYDEQTLTPVKLDNPAVHEEYDRCLGQ